MASKSAIIILASTLCFLSLLNSADAHDRFYVEGSVYCDPCRALFLTRLSHFLPGSTVKVVCKEAESGNTTLSKEAVTDAMGRYCVEVEGDRQDEICEVSLVKSSDPGCSDLDRSAFLNQAAKVTLTRNNGIVSPVRTVNPLCFLRPEPLHECDAVLHELGLALADDAN